MIHVLYSRAGIATQIILNNVLVDAGDGTLRDLLDAAYDFENLDVIIITHGHYDHMGGLHTLLGYLRMIGRKKILKILHPGACEVDTLIKGFQTCYKGTIPFQVDLVRVEDRKMYNINNVRIQPFFVCHAGSTAQGIMPSIPATGYRIFLEDKIVAVTGDSCMCTALKELVSGADIAFIEATWTEERKEMLTRKHGDIEEDMLSVHLSEEQAGCLGKLARKYVLIHK
jgi:ribonuclease BN (tRNA processing enzyme)